MTRPDSVNAQIDEIDAARDGERRIILEIYCPNECASLIATVYATPYGRIALAKGKKRIVPADPFTYAIEGWRDMNDQERDRAVRQRVEGIIEGDEPWPQELLPMREQLQSMPAEERWEWLTGHVAEASDIEAGFWHGTSRDALWLDDDRDDIELAVPCRRHGEQMLTAGQARQMTAEAARKRRRSTALGR